MTLQDARRPTDDRALDEALAHIGALSERLWAVRRLHRAVPARRGRWRCPTCAAPSPCPTLRAADQVDRGGTAAPAPGRRRAIR